LAIADRGRAEGGLKADVIIFDPATIMDNATFENPHKLSTGSVDVFVNGVAVLRNGQHTGAKRAWCARIRLRSLIPKRADGVGAGNSASTSTV
jgi:N-acyl-D-aspartate/D-glutamate deacylase